MFGRFKAANNTLIVSSFQMTGSGHNLSKLGQSVLVIIKAEAVTPGMFAISPLLFPIGFSFYYYSRKVIIAAHICEMDGM